MSTHRASTSGYGLDHLPYGVARRAGGDHVVVRLGGDAIDLRALADAVAPPGSVDVAVFAAPTLAPLMAAGPQVWADARSWLQDVLGDAASRAQVRPSLDPVEDVELRMPFEVADYVDFYASADHASNLGKMFRPGAEPLLPNWRHLPVGYHGRAGTVVPSGTPITRPRGQRRPTGGGDPEFGPSVRLDLEAELGFVVGVPTELGTSVGVDDFADHVFGVTLLNDWSARDIQSWEGMPLGPFLGKSFATSISPWITPLAALEPVRAAGPEQDPAPLDYLSSEHPGGYAIDLEVVINGTVVSRPPFALMYWSAAQMLAHLTVNGASLRTGDLYGSGTISGPDKAQRGSLIELCWGGEEPFVLDDGSERTFLQDGDTVTLRATAGTISLGEVTGQVVPSPSP